MNIVIAPALDGLASERLRAFAARLAEPAADADSIRETVTAETSWARRTALLNGQTRAYEAAVRLLADLRLLKWTVRADACGIELESPPGPKHRGASQAEIRAAKEDLRRELAPALASQFADPLVRRFIADLEEPPRLSRRKSVRALIADGAEVFARLQPAIDAIADDRPRLLASTIEPYLQLVPGEGEPTVLDEFTGIPLGDIWRYFRYTWSIPQTAIPGRQMFYLIRDRAHPANAVIGIAALGNSPLVSPPRDRAIGWHPDAYAARLRAAAGNQAELRRLFDHLECLVSAALDEIDPQGLARPEELVAPTDDLIARLQRRAEEFASRREDALREVAEAAVARVPLALQETELSDFALPPVSIGLLELEGKSAPKDAPETLARRLLVAKKRAFELARLCRARLNLATHRNRLLDPATTADTLAHDDFCVAMNTALTAAKSDRVGTNILEITTCGAVAPYNHMLGGKLVALLLLSPEVADDYRRRYGERPAIISSQLKNAERTKDCTLAWLNTTSLYAVGSSQYERLRLPAGTIAPDQPELRYQHLGDTEGYGTVQFSEETIEALQAALEDRGFVAWVRHFCKAGAWGGLIETTVPDLKRALEDFDRPETLTLNPEQLGVGPRGELSLSKLLDGWDEDLESQGKGRLGLLALWEQFKELRGQLLGSLEELTHFPLEWFAGKGEVREVAENYLKVCGQLFGLVARHYGTMAQADANWAKTTLEALLALDVVQVRTALPDGRRSSKAVLLPTHPLHLWRYWRLSNLLRGLGKELNPADRKAVIEEAGAPVQFLSVIYASPLPGSKGAAQVLPVANDLYSLATFENLRNAYNGPDGQSALVYAVERFAAAHRLHVNPLRLILVNAPQAGALLLDLLKLLDGRKKRLVERLRVEVRGTKAQEARLKQALLFDTREREIIEEKVSSGRLELVVNREARPLKDILDELKDRPAHLVAVFDEAPVTVRRGGAGQQLPMSPFCVRRKVAFHRRWNELRLEPVAGDPPFYEFIELIKHVEGNAGEGTPYAWPEAEALRESVDSVVSPEDFGAHWFFLADRALPEEGAMKAQRLLRRREGQRQVLLAARDYGALARLMLPVFEEDTPNLLMPVRRLEELLAEGAHLIGAGLLNLVKAQEGRVSPNDVIGLMGTLLAARDFMRRRPGALLVSTDSQLARTWLRLGTQGERCDLLGLYEEGSRLAVECIEVKTTKGAPRGGSDAEISGACKQVAATLAAVREGLGDTVNAEQAGQFLAAPRNEMLKEVLVQGCMGRFASEGERGRWAGWLTRLFGPAPESPDLRGAVVDVALGSAELKPEENLPTDGLTVKLRHLNEVDIERLLEPAGDEPPRDGGDDGTSGGPKKPADSPSGGASNIVSARESVTLPAKAIPEQPKHSSLRRNKTAADSQPPADLLGPDAPSAGSWTVTLGTTKDGQAVNWPPSIRGNPHLMIVGLPGMGKTTCLINLCHHLQAGGIAPIVFSYHDDIDERLSEHFPNVASHDCRDLGFNPMRIVQPGPVAHVEAAGQLRDIFSAIFPDLGDLQLEQLRGVIKDSFEGVGWGGARVPAHEPRFAAFLKALQKIKKPDRGTKTLLARLAELDDFGFFNAAEGGASLLNAATPQLIRIHAVANDVVQRAYASFVLYRVYQDMFRRGRQERLTHAVIFDEAHRASRLKLLPTMAKECRKYGLALIVASQEARDFDSGLFAAVANYLVLRVTDADARAMARNVAPSDQERRVADRLKNLSKFEALFFAEGQRHPQHCVLKQPE